MRTIIKTLAMLLFTATLAACSNQPEKAEAPADEANSKAATDEQCTALAAAINTCEENPEGPMGIIRQKCMESAKRDFKCSLPIEQVMKLR